MASAVGSSLSCLTSLRLGQVVFAVGSSGVALVPMGVLVVGWYCMDTLPASMSFGYIGCQVTVWLGFRLVGLLSFSGAVTALAGTESTSGLMMVALSSRYTLLGSAVDDSFLACSTKSQIAEASMSLGLTRPSVV